MKNSLALRWPGNKYKALTLSYDDGLNADKRMIEILDKYNIKCTFNLNNRQDDKHVRSDEFKEVYKNHEIAVHGVVHMNLTDFQGENVACEIIENRKFLEEASGKIVKGMAYANGRYNDEVVDILKKLNIKYARTTLRAKNFDIPKDWLKLEASAHHTDPDLFERCDEFLSYTIPDKPWLQRDAKMFYLWGHSYEFDRENNWELLEEFCKKMGNKEDVWYATNIEIYDYIQAFRRLEFSVECSRVFNPSNIPVWICVDFKDYKINPGETVELF